MTSNKVKYVVAGSMIGGAIGYLFLTDSGRKTVRSVRQFDPNRIPEKLNELRTTVERGGRDITRRVETVRHRIQDSFEAGRNVYMDPDNQLDAQLRRMESRNNQVAEEIHRAVDELNKTVLTVEKSVLSPFYEVTSLIRAVKRGWNTLKASPRPLAEAPKVTGIR